MRTVFAHIIFAVASVGITAGAVAASAPAVAATVSSAPSVTIETADLNLASVAGQATAKRRIDAAAYRVCGNAPDDRFGGTACHDRAVDAATQSLDLLSEGSQTAAR